MRKPRDYDSELKALTDKARALRQAKVAQLGELVIACGADALTPEQLAGALLAAVDGDAAAKEAWRMRGATFFQRSARANPQRADQGSGGATPSDRGTTSA